MSRLADEFYIVFYMTMHQLLSANCTSGEVYISRIGQIMRTFKSVYNIEVGLQ